MSRNTRIRLQLKNVKSADSKGQWFLVNHDECKLVADLVSVVRQKYFNGRPLKLELLIDGFGLPADAPIDLIRDNDIVLVKSSEEKNNTPKTSGSSSSSTKASGGKISASTPQRQQPLESKQTPKGETKQTAKQSESKSKAKPVKRFTYTRGAEFKQPLTGYTPHAYLTKIKHLDEFPSVFVGDASSEMDEKFVASIVQQLFRIKSKKDSGKGSNTAKRSIPFRTKKLPDHVSGITKCTNGPSTSLPTGIDILNLYRSEPLSTIPRVNDTIAYKIRKISHQTYIPEMSEFHVAEVTGLDREAGVLRLNLITNMTVPDIGGTLKQLKTIAVDLDSLVDVKLLLTEASKSSLGQENKSIVTSHATNPSLVSAINSTPSAS